MRLKPFKCRKEFEVLYHLKSASSPPSRSDVWRLIFCQSSQQCCSSLFNYRSRYPHWCTLTSSETISTSFQGLLFLVSSFVINVINLKHMRFITHRSSPRLFITQFTAYKVFVTNWRGDKITTSCSDKRLVVKCAMMKI